MISEDYYGFPSQQHNTTGFGREKSSYRTERSPKIGKLEPQSPKYKALKRTELSKEKILSKDSKKGRLPMSPHLQRQQTLQQQMSSRAYKPAPSYEESSYNRGQLQALTRKYDNYLKADSIQFFNDEISHARQSEYTKSIKMRPQSRPPMTQRNNYRQSNRVQNSSYEPKHYHSASRGRKQEFLNHFQREKIPTNAIDRANQTISSRSNNSRYKKSKSLTTEMKKQYKLHTFYHADRLKVLNYNEEGYLTQRQEQMLLIIEDRARRAFQRAANEYQNEQRSATKRPSRPKKFEIQQNSRIQHRNSDILSNLKQQSVNYHNHIPPEMSKRLSDRSQKYLTEEKVIDVSINPKKPSNLHNDYQLKPAAKNGYQASSSLSQFIDEKRASVQNKNGFSNFAKESQDSLLEFKPARHKKATKENQSKSITKQVEKDIQKSLENNSKHEQLQQNSKISHKSFKSIDMMEINSNCKINQKRESMQKQKIQNNYIDDNRSLGIDTLKDFPVKKKSNVEHKDSQLSISSSQSLSRSQTISQADSQSNSHQDSSKNSVSKSQFGSNKNFSKNKLKSSQSPSQAYSSSLHTQLIKPVQPKEKVKIKKVKKANEKLLSQQSESRNKIESLSALGSQSLNKIDVIEPIQIKINPVMDSSKKQMSRIDQKNQKVASVESSKFIQKSRMKEQSRMVESGMKSKRLNSVNNSISNKSHSIVQRAKQRTSKYGNESNLQYDIFNQIREFLEEEQYDYTQPRKQKQIPSQISNQLAEVIDCIEEHLYLLNCIVEIIIIVPDVYEFQTIYAKEKEWIFLPIFLTLKKYLYERGRVVTALSGGKNCFNLLGWTIEDAILKKYTQRPEVKNILTNLIECNSKLQIILANFETFLKKFKKLSNNQAYINTKPFNNNEELPVLLGQFQKQIDNLLKKRVEQFNNGHIKENDEQFEMLTLVNERIFRMTQVGFILSNLSGKQIKPYQKDEQLYREQQKFKDYILQNHPQFKRMVKNFK